MEIELRTIDGSIFTQKDVKNFDATQFGQPSHKLNPDGVITFEGTNSTMIFFVRHIISIKVFL